jgi:excisionase family DNA binding protein
MELGQALRMHSKNTKKSERIPGLFWGQGVLMHRSYGTSTEAGKTWSGTPTNRAVSAQTRGYYSTKAVAALLLVDVTTVRRWADAGKLKCFRTPGGHRRFTQSQVSDFIQKYQYVIA